MSRFRAVNLLGAVVASLLGQQVMRVPPREAPQKRAQPAKRNRLSRRSRRHMLAVIKRREKEKQQRGNKIAAVLAKGKHGHAIYG